MTQVCRRAFVTGGTSPMGTAIVRRFTQAGHEVSFSYNSNAVRAKELAAETGARAYALDFSRDWQAPGLDVDILVNNAGVNLATEEIFGTSDAEIETTMRINFYAPVRLIRQYGQGMRERGFGRIVTINSGMGLVPPARRLSYGASKHAMRAATRSLAQELAPSKITVNDVCPGPVDSFMFRAKAQAAVDAGRFPDTAAYLADFLAKVPTGSFILADEVAAAVAFLAAEDSGSITGVALRVDGGMYNL
jgi:NAD(P)-dependent dehydrogenase (short-subunit alcohol dehydrogenase family)